MPWLAVMLRCCTLAYDALLRTVPTAFETLILSPDKE